MRQVNYKFPAYGPMADSRPPCETDENWAVRLACAEEFVARLREILTSHYESLLPVLVNEFQALRADDEQVKQKLRACSRGLDGKAESCLSARCASSSKMGEQPILPELTDDSFLMEANGPQSLMDPDSAPPDVPIVSFNSRNDLLEDREHLDKLIEGQLLDEPKEADSLEGNPASPQNAQGATSNTTQTAQAKEKWLQKDGILFLGNLDMHHHLHYHRSNDQGVGCFRKFIFSNTFECISGIVIVLNAFVLAMKLQYAGFTHANKLYGPSGKGSKPADEVWPWAEDMFDYSDFVFNPLFIIELALRVWAMRRAALTSRWIWYDSVIILVGVIDVLTNGGVGIHPGMMRVLRILRTMRLLKIIRAMSGFDSLVLLIKSLQASRQAAIWSFVVLGLVQIIAGLFICQFVQEYLVDDTLTPDDHILIYQYFGSFSRTMLTTYEVTFGNWGISCRVLVEHVSEWFGVFYIAYRCLFLFAVLKVIAAVFITETNRVLEHDDELTVIKSSRDLSLFLQSYKKLVTRVDKNNDGMLSWHELEELLKDQGMKNLLPSLGFDKHDLMKLFWLIEDGVGSVSVDDFFDKLCKLKGPAKKINEMTMLKLVHKIHTMMQEVWEKQGLITHDIYGDAEAHAVED